MIRLTRRYHFSASHRLHSPLLSASENAQLFGKCNNPFGHGHDYVLEVTAAGEPASTTGLLLPTVELDRLVHDNVLQLFASRNLNLDVPQFANLVPTTENIALVIANLLQQNWNKYFESAAAARLHRVQVQETGRNSFEVLLRATQNKSIPQLTESLTIHA
jgi:6-pyruvoyltetrahydropterin/6-carboxytetrahydropterin synthase